MNVVDRIAALPPVPLPRAPESWLPWVAVILAARGYLLLAPATSAPHG